MWRTASVLVGLTLILSTMGIIMLASTSGFYAAQHFGDAHLFVKRQGVALVLALGIGFVFSQIDYRYWKTFAVPLAIFSGILLILALTPGIGIRAGGSYRWIGVGPVNFQPSELAKLATVILMAWYMSKAQRHLDKFGRGFFYPLLMLGFLVGLIFLAPDFGTTMLVGLVGMLILFAGGARISFLSVTALLGVVTFAYAIMQDSIRMRRVTAFLNPEKYAQDEAFQLLSAIYAFVIGGGRGVGLGHSMQKRFYLPESHTDFIFAIIGEELGLAASFSVVLLFTLIFIAGMYVALHASDLFGKLLALGLTTMITIQAAANIAVVTGVIPTKGLPLPFISYGGSSIVITMMMVGILINVALQANQEDE